MLHLEASKVCIFCKHHLHCIAKCTNWAFIPLILSHYIFWLLLFEFDRRERLGVTIILLVTHWSRSSKIFVFLNAWDHEISGELVLLPNLVETTPIAKLESRSQWRIHFAQAFFGELYLLFEIQWLAWNEPG